MGLETPEPPPGIELTADERIVWEQMITIRDEWEMFDLILLAKVVRLECQIREYDRVLMSRQDDLIDGLNPQGFDGVLKAQNTLQNQQLQVLTKMRVMENRGDPRTINKKSPIAVMPEDDKVRSLIPGMK
jgi:hypothetical protein